MLKSEAQKDNGLLRRELISQARSEKGHWKKKGRGKEKRKREMQVKRNCPDLNKRGKF